MRNEKIPALPAIEKERDGLTVRIGHSVLVQSKDGIALNSPMIEIKETISQVSDKRNQKP